MFIQISLKGLGSGSFSYIAYACVDIIWNFELIVILLLDIRLELFYHHFFLKGELSIDLTRMLI